MVINKVMHVSTDPLTLEIWVHPWLFPRINSLVVELQAERVPALKIPDTYEWMFVDRSLCLRPADPCSGTETLGIPAFSKLDLQWSHTRLLFVFFCSTAQSHGPSCLLTFLKPSQVLLMSHPDCGDFLPAPLHLPSSCPGALCSGQMHSLLLQHLECALLSGFLPLGWLPWRVCSPLLSHPSLLGFPVLLTRDVLWLVHSGHSRDDRPFTGGHGPRLPVVASLLCGLISSSQVAGTV